MLDKIAAFISGAGFAVFACVWLMLRTDKKIDQLHDAIDELTRAIRAKL